MSSSSSERSQVAARFRSVRALSERLMAPLAPEDFRIQSMPDVSPPYWNLGHTSWFFAANALQPFARAPQGFAGFDYAFNSYYEGLGPRLPRAMRGRVAQPSTAAVREYRAAVDAAVLRWIDECPATAWAGLAEVIAIGLQHEQQHQELFVTEILHIRWSAPDALRVPYAARSAAWISAQSSPHASSRPLRALPCPAALTTLGHQAGGFCWDNELPPHRVHVGDFAIGDRLVTNGEWLQFMADGGYRRPLLWLSNGWAAVQQHGWQAPLYWQQDGARWQRFSLRGLADVDPHAPVCHVSFYEADAFARWYGEQSADWRHARLPRESEWEHAARVHGFDAATANLLDDDVERTALDVVSAAESEDHTTATHRAAVVNLAGNAWQWTLSHYEPYPGYRPFAGALMEYNGKFMDNQRVLRGGSFATPRAHARVAYRNFWPPDTRFQATSVRLLRDG